MKANKKFPFSSTVYLDNMTLTCPCGHSVNGEGLVPIANTTLYNVVSISGDVHRIPTKIERKKARNYKKKRNALKFGFKTEYLTNQSACRIVLDGDGLFLASDFTVLKDI